jgi:UDP-N-acetylglucosamine 2-epimerase
MKIITVIGARPQFIKAVSLSKILRKHHEELIIHTGQHYDTNMSDVFFEELHIPKPEYHLDLGGGNHGKQTGVMLEKIEDILLKEKPDLVIVYGDTNSTLAGGLASAKLHIPVAHIEAGLRSFNKKMPEEINRILTDHLSDILFVPSADAVKQLNSEGIFENIHDVGDIMYDSILNFKNLSLEKSKILEQLSLHPKGYSLATVHRPENTDNQQKLKSIFNALSSLDKNIVIPIHPRTKNKIKEYNLDFNTKRIQLIEPLGYLDMLNLMSNAYSILTDSGGIQKEAYYLSVPCITMREQTEWKETLATGWNTLVGSDSKAIQEAYFDLPNKLNLNRPDLYGDGHCAEEISKVIDQIKI